jgi:hypothetical protein
MSATRRTLIGTLVLCLTVAACSVPRPASPGNRDPLNQRVAAQIESGTIRFSGGDGSPSGEPIVIEGAPSEMEGIAAEYLYIAKRHPPHEWASRRQSFDCSDARCFDHIEITLTSGKVVSYDFDITAFSPPPDGHERPPEIPFSVASRDRVLHFSAATPFDTLTCWRDPTVVWAAQCKRESGCSGDFVYGDERLESEEGPHPLAEGAYLCNARRGEEGRDGLGVVEFCLTGRQEIGACRRD